MEVNVFDTRNMSIDDIPLREGQLIIGKDKDSAEMWFDFNSNRYAIRDGKAIVRSKISGGEGGASKLSKLEDVNVVGVADNDVLTYDAATSKWIPSNGGSGASALEDLTDVTVHTPQSGQVLGHNGTKWVNKLVSLDELNDVNPSMTPAANKVLMYDGITYKWTASTVPCIPAGPIGVNGNNQLTLRLRSSVNGGSGLATQNISGSGNLYINTDNTLQISDTNQLGVAESMYPQFVTQAEYDALTPAQKSAGWYIIRE